jgi:hypothetical protein
MDFTPGEMKLIERLRKQERRWRWTRWLLLGMGAFLLVAYGYLACMLYDHSMSSFGSDRFDTQVALLILALVWPKILMMLGLAGVFIGWAIRDWHGNVTRMLLLKLLDAHQRPSARDEKTA